MNGCRKTNPYNLQHPSCRVTAIFNFIDTSNSLGFLN
uniref:Uncharacterized protein n=1 Tax=Rhizophora mucronata TaxID=61149 RepID=A0A2P2JI04_RHIMU